jgi:hypothetical protein
MSDGASAIQALASLGQGDVGTQSVAPATTGVQPGPQVPIPTTGLPGGQSASDLLAAIQQQQAQNQPPANATAPLNMGTPAPYVGTPTAPNVAVHMNWLQRALSDVSSILGGDKTLTIKTAPDGSATLSQEPSTQGEKWGRIAAAALSGAAQGFAHSTGTNALPQAAAAGFQTGMQIPVNQEQQRQQEASFQNQQLMNNANRIHLIQQTHLLAQTAQMNDLQMDQQTANLMNAGADMLKRSPNAVDLGSYDPADPNGAMNFARAHPAAMDGFLGKGNQVMRVVMEPDHQMHAILTDKAWEDQMNSTPMEAYYVGADAKGRPTMMTKTVPPNSRPNSDILNNNDAARTQYYKSLDSWAKAQQSEAAANKPEKPQLAGNFGQAMSMAALADNPEDKQKWTNVANSIQAHDISEKRAGRQPAAPLGNDVLNALQDYVTDPTTGGDMSKIPAGTRVQLLAHMAANGVKPAHPMTADEIKRVDLANIAVQNLNVARGILQQHPEIFGPAGYASTQFSKALRGGNPYAIQFQTAMNLANLPLIGIHGVRGRWAADDLAKTDSNLYLNPDSMREALDTAYNSANQIVTTRGGRPTEPGAPPAPGAPAAGAPAPAAAAQPPAVPAQRPPAGQAYVWAPGAAQWKQVPAAQLPALQQRVKGLQVQQ